MTHLESLWQLLNLRKALLLTQHGQDSFDQLNIIFKEPIQAAGAPTTANIFDNKLTSEENDIMRDICKNKEYLKKQNLFNALSLLHKLIVNKLMTIINVNDDENTMNPTMSLEDILSEMSSDETSNLQAKSNDQVYLDEFCLRGFQLRHVYHVWKLFVCIYLNKNDN